MNVDTLAIVGMGLMGGSVARAARHHSVARRIVGVETNASHHRIAERIADVVVSDLLHGEVLAADIIVVCTPVDRIVEQCIALAGHCRTDALVTDVGSTKAFIVGSVERTIGANTLFVGSHPLAGSEKCGPAHADPDLFRDRLCVVTPTRNTRPEALARATEFWESLGSRVQHLSPEEHDHAVALTSHLPHLVASALAGTLPPELDALTATGFRDTTRLAASQPDLWSAILQQNAPAILDALSQLQARLDAFRDGLQSSNNELLRTLLAEGKRVKERLG